jgi:hypothetical protein
MDETSLWFDLPSSTSYDLHGVKTTGIRGGRETSIQWCWLPWLVAGSSQQWSYSRVSRTFPRVDSLMMWSCRSVQVVTCQQE